LATSQITFTPSLTFKAALGRACQMWGVQEDYWDIFGTQHIALPEVLTTVLRSLGVAAGNIEDLDSAVEARMWAEWSTPVGPTVVASLSDGAIPIRLSQGTSAEARFEWENGSADSVRLDASADAPPDLPGEAKLRGQHFRQVLLPLPTGAAPGYHKLVIRTSGGQTSDTRLILCPDRAFMPRLPGSSGKGAGIAVSVYGLRSDRNWGCGDFTDLEQFTDWARSALGVSFVALNPLHSIPNRAPYNTSPYLPNCSFYRNGIYIDIERLPHLTNSRMATRLLASTRFQSCLAELRGAAHVEYERVWRIKLTFLRLAFREFLRANPQGSADREAFEKYNRSEGELLHKFAVYQALDQTLHKRDRNLWIWPDWPEAYRNPDSPEVAAFEREHSGLIAFFKYVQWQLDAQLAAAHRYATQRGLEIGLYHDLALATDRCGSDLWAHPSFYVAGCRVGSPPDDFSPKGQDWAFPPPNTAQHRETGYELFIQSIRKNASHGGALRIDHVMRFFRLFWITDGQEAAQGVYVRDNSDDLIRILALESVREQFVVIGEDLGTVEPYIRKALNRFGILSYRLLYFERALDGSFRTPSEYPVDALVSISTHDLPTLAGFWESRDIDARLRAGVLPDEASRQEQLRSRAVDKQRILDVLLAADLMPPWFPRRASEVPEFTGELHNAVVGFLAKTPSLLFVLNQEDLFKEADQQNLPGTTAQYPNWRHKMRYALSELYSDEQARGCALMFRSWLAKTGRL